MPTLRQLQILVTLASAERFHEAARRLGIAQSAVTAQIKALETRLGAALVDRGRHGARLTPIGEEVVTRARSILADVEALERSVKADAAELGGVIRLGCLPTIGPYLLPLVTPILHQTYPQLRLVVREASTDELESMLISGTLDTIVSTAPNSPTLDSEQLCAEHVLVGLAVDDPLAKRTTVEMKDLAGRDILTLGEGHQLGRMTTIFAEQAGARVRTDYTGSSLDALRHMVATGTGLALIPQLYARSEIEGRDDVVVRPLDSVRAVRAIHLAWRRGSARVPDYRKLSAVIGPVAQARLTPPSKSKR